MLNSVHEEFVSIAEWSFIGVTVDDDELIVVKTADARGSWEWSFLEAKNFLLISRSCLFGYGEEKNGWKYMCIRDMTSISNK